MPVKINRSQKRLIALTITERAKPRFFRLLKRFMKDEILNTIKGGRSPVAKGGSNGTSGKLRYEKYSESYSKAIDKGYVRGKNKRPVNLTSSGKMLNSLKYRITRDGFKLWFTSPIAKYHDKLGASKKKVIRRMLPGDGESFNTGIARRVVNALEKAIKLSKK